MARGTQRSLGAIALEPSWLRFFLAAVLLHAALKLSLGLSWVLQDGYAWWSVVAPPFGLALAASDVLVSYLLARTLAAVTPQTWAYRVQVVTLAALGLLLSVNAGLHVYFRAFLNLGLIRFSGASARELLSYVGSPEVLAYALPFAAFALLSVCGFARMVRRPTTSLWLDVPHRQLVLLCVAGALLIGLTRLSAGQTGWLRSSPLYVLASSVVYDARQRKLHVSDDGHDFERPTGPLAGRYDDALAAIPSPQPKRNVLLLLIESLPLERTPPSDPGSPLRVFGELASRGIAFEQYRTVFPATSRSFLTMHCGEYPNSDASTVTKYRPDFECDSLLDVVKRAGYRTGLFTASVMTYDNMHRAGFMRGYDVVHDYTTLRDRSRSAGLLTQAVEEEVVADAVESFIRSDTSVPFFATYFVFWSHSPYRLPFEDISDLPAEERYTRTLAYVDEVLRGLLERLGPALDDTIVIATADHGEGFGRHGNYNHVGHVWEEDIKVPLVIALPGMSGPVRTARQGSHEDFAPTVAARLGLQGSTNWTGQDLLGAQFRGRPQLFFSRAAYSADGVLDGNYKYVRRPLDEAEQLYDLASDPREQRDLATQLPDLTHAYRDLTDRWLARVDARWQAGLKPEAPMASSPPPASAQVTSTTLHPFDALHETLTSTFTTISEDPAN